MTSLPPGFYSRDVVDVARDLLGKVLLKDGVGGPIVEAEAYHQDEASCHGHRGRTQRNQHLFGPGGTLYVYRIHRSVCANVVTGRAGVAEAVLVRALVPTDGRRRVAARRRGQPQRSWSDGPGKVCRALAIDLEDDGTPIGAEGAVVLLDRGLRFGDDEVLVGPRVGISKATELPWRFRVRPEVSRRIRPGAGR